MFKKYFNSFADLLLKYKIVDLRSDYSSSILKVFSGGSVAFIIGFIAMPIISRIYPPEEFGKYQLMLSIVTSVSVIASFRLNMALVLEKEKEDRDALTSLVLIIILFTSILFFLTMYFFGDFILTHLSAIELKPYIFIMSIMFLFYAIYDVTNYLYVANSKFGKFAKNNVIYQSTSSSTQIFGGLITANFISLFLSQTISYFITFFYGYKNLKFSLILDKKKYNSFLLKHKNFIYFETPSILISSTTGKLPIFFFAKYHGVEYAAFYSMALLIFNAPMGVVISSFASVFYKEVSDNYQNKKILSELFSNTLKKLSAIIIISHIIVFTISDILISLYLGDNWLETSRLIRFLIFYSGLSLIFTTFSYSLSAINKQKNLFIMNLILLFCTFISLFIFRFDFLNMVISYSIFISIVYVFLNILIYKLFRKR